MKTIDISEFEKYKVEAKEKWGKTPAYKEYEKQTENYSTQKWNDLGVQMDCIMSAFAVCAKNGSAPDSQEAQKLVTALQNHITQNYYPCTNEILAGLGQMYVSNARFQNNIDKHGDGTAAFIREAITLYCKK